MQSELCDRSCSQNVLMMIYMTIHCQCSKSPVSDTGCPHATVPPSVI